MDFLQEILLSQYEASLAMLRQCVAACRPEHWEGKIANDSFRQIAYHTLFFTDLYLTADENAFVLRDLNLRGGDERGDELSPGLSQADTLEYVALCRAKAKEVLAAETPETFRNPSGFSWRKCTRAELHIYNIRHVQHHTGAMCAYLRRVDDNLRKSKTIGWVSHGWRE